MSHKRTFMSPKDKVKRPPKAIYAPYYDHIESLSVFGGPASFHKMTFDKAGHLRGGSVTFRVLTNTPAPLIVSLPDGRSWTIPVDQGKNNLKLDCAVKEGSRLVFELSGVREAEDVFIYYEFAEETK